MYPRARDRNLSSHPALLAVPPAGRSIMQGIVEKLTALEQRNPASPLDPDFRTGFSGTLDLVDRYLSVAVAGSEGCVSCKRGCSVCCCHWVEDVNSFEAEIIADYLRTVCPERIPAIAGRCSGDCRELERLEKMVERRLQEIGVPDNTPPVDPVDLLLSVFYQMRRPCPLLADDGSCLVYEVRPLTCRIYVSFSDPIRCDPEYITTSMVPTCLIDLSESANSLLDSLHFKYVRFEGDTGLRSLLPRYLSAS